MKNLIWLTIFTCSNVFSQNNVSTGLIFTDPNTYEDIGVAPLPYGTGSIPNSIDLSANMPPVGNQYQQNSCVAWATTYACLSYYQKTQNNYSYTLNGNIDYSRVFSPAYVYNQINGGQNRGTHFEDAFNILRDEGACSYKMMPYDPNDWITQPNSAQENEARRYRVQTHRRVNLDQAVTNLKAQLLNSNPIVIATVFDETYYRGGYDFNGIDYVWNSIGNINGLMGHAIVIVGFDDSKNAFKIMNSWGSSWGNNGYGWISYNIVDNVIREAYILKIRSDNDTSPVPNYLSDTKNELDNADINSYGLNFTIISVVHQNNMNSPHIPIQNRQMGINGWVDLPAGIGKTAQVVINFYLDAGGGSKGVSVASLNYNFMLPNGQAATGTSILNLPLNNATHTSWWASIPYVALNIPRGRMVPTPYGPQYQAAITSLVAEPVLFIDNFPIRVGQIIPFQVSF